MKLAMFFAKSDSGAVSVDWVVLTSAIVGIALAVLFAVSGGMRDATGDISNGVGNQTSFTFGTQNAAHYFDIGIAAYPNDQTQAWLAARLAVDEDAPAGFEYDPNRTTTRYVDDATGQPIYVSDDGSNYSIGANVVAASDYDNSGRTSFLNTFNRYWDESRQ